MNPTIRRAWPVLVCLVFLASCSDEITVVENHVGVTILPFDVRLTTQEEVDLLAGVEEIRGDLLIGPSLDGDMITDLSPLESLELIGGNLSIVDAPGLESLACLQGADVGGTYLQIEGLAGLSDLAGLPSLSGIRTVSIDQIPLTNLEGLRLPPGPVIIQIENCADLKSLKGMEGVVLIPNLYVHGCGLDTLSCPATLRQLDYLTMSDLPFLEGVGDMGEVEIPCSVRVASCNGFQDWEGLGRQLPIRSLQVDFSEGPSSPEDLSSMEGLEYLIFQDAPGLESLSGLSVLSGLRSLRLFGCTALQNLEGLEGLPNLSNLWLDLWNTPTSLEGMGDLPILRELTLIGHPGLTTLAPIPEYASLGTLDLSNLPELVALEGLKGQPEVWELSFRGMGLVDFEGMGDFPGLRSLSLSGLNELVSCRGLALPDSLHELSVSFNSKLGDLDGLQDLRHCDELAIYWNDGLTDLTGLDNLVTVGSGGLQVSYNRSLDECLALEFAEGIEVAGSVSIHGNAPCE